MTERLSIAQDLFKTLEINNKYFLPLRNLLTLVLGQKAQSYCVGGGSGANSVLGALRRGVNWAWTGLARRGSQSRGTHKIWKDKDDWKGAFGTEEWKDSPCRALGAGKGRKGEERKLSECLLCAVVGGGHCTQRSPLIISWILQQLYVAIIPSSCTFHR